MADAPDYYAVLGVSPTADRVIIHAAWKGLLRRYHPDANPGVDVSARAKAINEAYSVLGKEEERAAYDRARRAPPPRPHAARPPSYANRSGRSPIRPRPSARPSSVSQPLDADQWVVGLLLLLLTTAPLAMILVLYHEEAQAAYPVRPDAAILGQPRTPAGLVRSSSNATFPPR